MVEMVEFAVHVASRQVRKDGTCKSPGPCETIPSFLHPIKENGAHPGCPDGVGAIFLWMKFHPQSLTLWREIMHDMFRLWCLGEEDLLSETMPYKLSDTGQGKQRVQQSPRTFKAMQVRSRIVRLLHRREIPTRL